MMNSSSGGRWPPDAENELENFSDGCEDISLIGVQVTSEQFGIGTVIAQDVNKIDVQFPEKTVTFILSKKYESRPRFEDDDTIVEAFTSYGERMDRINALKRQMRLYYLQEKT